MQQASCTRYARNVANIELFPGDSALLLMLLVVGAFVVLGTITDGLRMAMLFVGSLLSLLLAPLLERYVVPRGFLPANPLWQEMGIGNVYAFIFLMMILFAVIHKLRERTALEIKYALELRKHEEWLRLNSVIGLALGGITGVFYFLMIAGKITPLGYVTAQMQPANPSADPAGYRLSARLYKDFHALGVDKAARLFDPASPEYYAAADVAGLIYNNFGTNSPQHVYQFRARLMGYPGLVDAAFNPHVMQLTHVQNPFFLGLRSRANLTHLLANQTLQSAMGDNNLRMQLAQVNMDDLLLHLDPEKGSTNYTTASLVQQGRAPILGRWILDVDNTLQQFYTQYPNMPERARRNLETYIKAIGDQMSLSFSDGNFYLEAKYFCARALARKSSDFIPKTPSKSIRSIQQSSPVLQVFGAWQKGNDSQYRAVFRWTNPRTSQVTVECPVRIWPGPTQIMLTLEGFNNEKYVFRRQKM